MSDAHKLYITRLTDKALETFEDELFTRATKDYLLIYTDSINEYDFKVVEVPPDMAKERLTDAESKWLLSCQIDILNSELLKKAPEVIENINERIDALEEALEKERAKAVEGDTDAEQLE